MYVQNKKQRQAEHEFANVSLEDLLMQGSKGRMLYEAAHGVDRGPPVGQLWSPGGELDLAARGDEALGRSLVTGDGFDDDFEGFVGRGANPLFDDALGASRSDLNASAHNPLRETRLGHMALDGDVRGVNPLQGGAGGDKWIDDSGTFVGGSRHQGGGVDLESMVAGGANPIYDDALGASDMDLSASRSNPLREQVLNIAAHDVHGRGPAGGRWVGAVDFDGDARSVSVMNPAHRESSVSSFAFDGSVRALRVARRKSISIEMEGGTFSGAMNPAHRGSTGLDGAARKRTSSQFSGTNEMVARNRQPSIGLVPSKGRTRSQFSAPNPLTRAIAVDGSAHALTGKKRNGSQFAGANPLSAVAFDGSVRTIQVARRRSISIRPVETAKSYHIGDVRTTPLPPTLSMSSSGKPAAATRRDREHVNVKTSGRSKGGGRKRGISIHIDFDSGSTEDVLASPAVVNPMNKNVQLKRAATLLALREANEAAKARSPVPVRQNPMAAKPVRKKRSPSKFAGANPMAVAFDGGVRTLKVARNRNSMTIDMHELETIANDHIGMGSVAEAEEGTDANGGLPSGWSTHTQPVTGAVYYHNDASGETLWTHPKHHAGLADGWEPVVDDDGDVYFHNAGRGETVWEKPLRDDIESGAPSSSPNHEAHVVDIESEGDELPPGWVAAEHDSGGVFYHHEETGESTWEKPQQAPSAPAVDQLPSGEEHSLPPGWLAVQHDEGGTFFFHEETRESVWEKPEVEPADEFDFDA
jgi:hypothetical protein